MSSTFAKWFWPIYMTAAAINASVWLWRNFPLVLIIVVAAALMIFLSNRKEQRRRREQGYWLEYQGPGILRGDADEFAVAYHEAVGHFAFYGKEGLGSSPDIITVPSQLVWRLQTPEWMAERRELILTRIQSELKRRKYGRQVRIAVEDKRI